MRAVVRTVKGNDLEKTVPNAGFRFKRNKKLIAEIGQSRTDGGYRFRVGNDGYIVFFKNCLQSSDVVGMLVRDKYRPDLGKR